MGRTYGGVHATGGDMGDVLQQLRLGNSRVTHQADVDIPTDFDAIHTCEGYTTNQLQRDEFGRDCTPASGRGVRTWSSKAFFTSSCP